MAVRARRGVAATACDNFRELAYLIGWWCRGLAATMCDGFRPLLNTYYVFYYYEYLIRLLLLLNT